MLSADHNETKPSGAKRECITHGYQEHALIDIDDQSYWLKMT
jgi:hypothetical protein